MDAERILGALVGGALLRGLAGGGRHRHRHRRRGGAFLPTPGMRGMLGMGALGVAIAAFDHFARQQKMAGRQTFSGGPAPGAPGVAPPPPPPPPPPPGSSARTAPPPPSAAAPAAGEEEALLMVRAMIAAANADHELDAEERARILSTIEESGASEDDRATLLAELERPLDIAALAARATSPALRRDVYLASEMAIDADTRAEQSYLARLARELGLDPAQVDELRRMLRESRREPSAS
jgi:uncharacterized membrane protein YebE (DUF533 family)